LINHKNVGYEFNVDVGNVIIGFRTASEACCETRGRLAGILPCGPTSSLCTDRSKHVFWDAYHPTEAANLLIADKLLYGDSKFVTPFNLLHLRDL